MTTPDRYASILNTVLEIAKTRGQEKHGPDAAMFAYELIEAALSEAEVWGVSPEEIGLADFDPMDMLRKRQAA